MHALSCTIPDTETSSEKFFLWHRNLLNLPSHFYLVHSFRENWCPSKFCHSPHKLSGLYYYYCHFFVNCNHHNAMESINFFFECLNARGKLFLLKTLLISLDPSFFLNLSTEVWEDSGENPCFSRHKNNVAEIGYYGIEDPFPNVISKLRRFKEDTECRLFVVSKP